MGGALAGADGACESMCDQSEGENDTWCRESAGEQECLDVLRGLGVFVAYTIALGFIPLIVGIVGFAVAGAACCGCCKANPNAQNPGGTVVQGSVVAKS